MYQTGYRRRDQQLSGFGGSIEVEDPATHTRCEAVERRIRPIAEAVPDLLVRVATPFLNHPRAHVRLHHAAYAAFTRLKRAAADAGVAPDLLTIVSGYRSVANQKLLWERALARYGSPAAARVYVAPPGGSPHHSGRAIDFYLGTPNDSANIPALRGTTAYRWLVCNAARFGFTPYRAEPWHWEFNPPGLDPYLPIPPNSRMEGGLRLRRNLQPGMMASA
jgi:D-alanyl-D-alanine dipeptidase